MIMKKENIIEIRGLKKYFPIKKGILRKTAGFTKAVDNINIDIHKGETIGLVGESGCGKTTLGKCILQLIKTTEGSIHYIDKSGIKNNILSLKNNEKLKVKKEIQVIFQDPFSSLNPSATIFKTLYEPLKIHGFKDIKKRITEILESVNLSPKYMYRYPHEFSGGQRQRIGIARALSVQPEVIICDEPVSSLDVSIQAQVLELLISLQKNNNLTYIFITHDMSVVEYISNRVAIMYLGEIVELIDTDKLVSNCKHPYTEALISAVPVYGSNKNLKRIILDGDVPDPSNPPSGCYFHPRCKHAIKKCSYEKPIFKKINVNGSHFASCHLL